MCRLFVPYGIEVVSPLVGRPGQLVCARRHNQGDEGMIAFITIVLGGACAFYGYALAQFGREIRLIRGERKRGAALVVPFRGMPESAGYSDLSAREKVTVLPVNGMANRDVA